jgi:hypothetical protein
MLAMAPKKAVTVARKSTRLATRSTVPLSGNQNTGLPSKSADTVVGSPKKSAKRSSRVANSSKVSRMKPSRQRNRNASSPEVLDSPENTEPKELLRSVTAEEIDEQSVSSDEVSEIIRNAVVTDEGRESSRHLADPHEGTVAGHRSTSCDQSLTQIVRSRPRSVKRGRAASSNLASAKEQGQCERQRQTKSPVGAALLDCERAENRRRPQSRASRPDHSACLDMAEHAHPRDRGGCAETHAQRPGRTRTEGLEGENIVGEGRGSSGHINDGLLHGRHLQSRQSLGRRYPSPNGRREQCDAGFHPFDIRRRAPPAIVIRCRHPSACATRAKDKVRRRPVMYAIRLDAIRCRHPSASPFARKTRCVAIRS